MNLSKEKSYTEDSKIWKEFKDGDERAFSFLFRQYYSFLYNYGVKLTSNPDLTKDSIQELFITLWNNRENLGDAPSIKFYLLKSIRRKIVRDLKSQKKHISRMLPEEYEFEIVFSIENLLIKEQLKKEQQEYFLQLLNCLSKRQKEAIYLKFYQNLSYEEISEIMGLSYQSLRNYIHQAITTLRTKMKVTVNTLLLLILATMS